MKRTQIYLDEEQDKLLAERAHDEARTKSDLIRQAVDEYLTKHRVEPHEERMRRFRAAVDAVAGIAPYLPPGDEYVRELRKADLARQEMLEKRWRG